MSYFVENEITILIHSIIIFEIRSYDKSGGKILKNKFTLYGGLSWRSGSAIDLQ